MPKRKELPAEVSHKTVTYEEVLIQLNAHLVSEYGSLTGFTRSALYTKCGFTEADSSKIISYLSVPKNGADKKVKSLPVLTNIYNRVFKEKLSYKLIVRKEHQIFLDK